MSFVFRHLERNDGAGWQIRAGCIHSALFFPHMTVQRTLGVLTFVAWLALGAVAQSSHTLKYSLVTPTVLQHRLYLAASKNTVRESVLKSLFEQSGCGAAHLTEQPVRHEHSPNVICTLPGSSPSIILVGAHYDHVAKGMGVVDNWSGASLLPSLLESIRHQPRKHTFVFIGFTGEEHGLVGSAFYVKHLTPAQKGRIQVMINLDTLALGPTEVWLRHSDRPYAAALFRLADTMHLPLQVMNVDGVGDDDSHTFINAGIPTLMVHSVTAKTWPILHTRADNRKAVHFDDYDNSYRLLAAYLAWIDMSGS